MTASRDTRDTERLIRLYLEEGPTELPTRSYEAVDDLIDRTNQRAGSSLRGKTTSSILGRLGLVAAAVVVATIVGINLLRGGAPTSPGGLTTPSPSAGPSANTSPSADGDGSIALTYRWPAVLEAGSYETSFVWDPAYLFHFRVPSGWESSDISLLKGNRIAVSIYIVENVVIDACTRTLPKMPVTGPATAVVDALKKLVTIDVGPRAANVDARNATFIEFTVGPPVGCSASQYALIKMPAMACSDGCGGLGGIWNGLEFGGVKEHKRLWLMDVGRHTVIVAAAWTDAASAADLAELQAVIDSVYLETPLATEPPRAAPVGS